MRIFRNNNEMAEKDLRDLVRRARQRLVIATGGDLKFWGRPGVIAAIEAASQKLGPDSVIFLYYPDPPFSEDHPIAEMAQRGVITLLATRKPISRHFRIADDLHATIECPHEPGAEKRWCKSFRNSPYAIKELQRELLNLVEAWPISSIPVSQ